MQTTLTAGGRVIDAAPAKFGLLRESTEHAADADVLRDRLRDDGYVFLRDVLDKEILLHVQLLVAEELERRGALDPEGDRSTNLFPARPGMSLYEVADNVSQIERNVLSHQPALQAIFDAIFDEAARPLDYSWPRVAGPGRFEPPHSDWVYLCRGTSRLYSAWVPLMDLPLSHGPLMVLENSHRDNPYTRCYLQMDADKLGYFDGARLKHGTLVHGGRYSRRPDRVRDEFGTRWLSTDFRLGDVIIFDPRNVHTTLDNRSEGYRISIDLRFQPVNDPIDPRFAGPNPVAHSGRGVTIFDQAKRLYLGVRRHVHQQHSEVRRPAVAR